MKVEGQLRAIPPRHESAGSEPVENPAVIGGRALIPAVRETAIEPLESTHNSRSQ
jgi:hypothetical protein